jgi:endonuclease YncB( thermonuclease family)
MVKFLLILASLVTVANAAVGNMRDEIPGPVEAEILRVVDGDTLLVEAQPWPQQKMEVYVRIRGIDAPELKSKCAAIRLAGLNAREALEELVAGADGIQLTRISGDKYFGRIVADVKLADGHNAADHLLLAGLVVSYDGGRKPREVCDAS